MLGLAAMQRIGFVQADGSSVGRRVVVDDHIDAGDELVEQVAAGRVVQVEGDALLAGVEVQVESAALGMGRRRWGTGRGGGMDRRRWAVRP